MARDWLFCKVLVILGLVLGGVVLSAASARAFYWYDWPGSSVPTTTPTTGTKVTTKTTTPGGGGDGPGGGPQVPEPTSLLAMGIGLGVVGTVRAIKGKKKRRKERGGTPSP